MAAYAALVSLMHIIDRIENHPSPPIILHKQQVQSLTEKVNFLQEFLETYQSPVVNHDEADPLEMRIANAAYAAEDVIESNIVDAIKLGISTTTSHQTFDSGEGTSASDGLWTQRKSKISFDYFGCLMKPINHGQKINMLYQGLQKVIQDMSVIKKKAMKIKKGKTEVDAQLQRNMSTSAAASSRSSAMVGFEDVLLEILEKLTAEEHHRQVIPIVGMGGIDAHEIWKMPQLRHVEFHKGGLSFPHHPSGNIVIMKNLQTLKGINDLNWDEASKIIPNIKKLGVVGRVPSNLIFLSKLESCHCWGIYDVDWCTFPYSLKKLSLGSNRTRHWELNEEILEMIGALPLLQKLKLERAEFRIRRKAETSVDKYSWVTSEDRFPSLKYLELRRCLLESWMSESSHFPRLERLHLYELKFLEEIPSEIGEIATLQSIVLEYCSESAVESAKNITEEQEDLHVRVVLLNTHKNQALRSLATPNFQVEIVDFY